MTTQNNLVLKWISQDIPGYASLRFSYLLIPRYVSLENLFWRPSDTSNPGYASLYNLSQVILGYLISENLYWDIPGYPDLPGRSFFQMNLLVRIIV